MDKFKDQDSMLPAATDDKKKAIVAKTGGKTQVIINPPEKVDPQRGYQERFKHALEKHSVIIEKKTELILQSKAARTEIPQYTLEQVFKRGYKALPLNSQLTREQYAMNRVNSFVAGGAAMVEDCDLLPIVERVGIKGTGGGARPHIKREKSPYNGKTVFHVVDAKGNTKHSTSDEFEAKKHLATKYNAYMESTLSPLKRFEGTKSLVKIYKDDTPGEGKKDVAEGAKEDMSKEVKAMSTGTCPHCQGPVKKKEHPTLTQYHCAKCGIRASIDKQNVVEDNKEKTPGIALSKAYKKDFNNKYPKAKQPEDIALSAAYSKTGKPGGPLVKEENVAEEVKKGLYYYINKRKEAGISRSKNNPKAPSAQDWKNAAKTAKEEVDLSELSNEVLARYKAKAGEQASAADKAGDFKKGNKRFSGIMKATRKQFDNDVRKEERVVSGGYRDKTGKMHPPVTGSGIAKSNADKQKQIADILKAHRERK